tara:strand:+ start:1586 stop:2275 length:690 start_codon:yes stop_codon:yes gene_type:complete
MAKSKGAIIKKVFEEIAADDRCELTVEELLKFAVDGGLKLPKGKAKKDGPKRKYSGWNIYLKFYRSSFDSIKDCGDSWKSLTEVDQGKFNDLAVVMTTDRDSGNEKELEEYDNPLLVPSFEDVDKNGDGVISKEEFEKSQEQIKKEEKKLKKTKKKTEDELKKKKAMEKQEKKKEEELKELKKKEEEERELERKKAEEEAQKSIQKEQEILDEASDDEDEESDESDEED